LFPFLINLTYMKLIISIIIVWASFSCNNSNHLLLSSETFDIEIDDQGKLLAMKDKHSGIDYLSKDSTSYLIQIRKDNAFFTPKSAVHDQNTLTLTFDKGIEVHISVLQTDSHIRFEILSVSDSTLDLLQWGPYHTSIDSIVGETIGVVQGKEFSIGLQALNVKTLGGYPWNENDAMPQFDIFDSNDYTDMSEEGKGYTLYRVEAAKPTKYGSSLQAYVRNRSHTRIIKNWGHASYTAPSYNDGGLVGSKIALFGVPVSESLNTIGEIEISEGLPHPMIDGQWGKVARSAAAAYMIMGFNESNLQECLNYTTQAGLRYLYHGGPFENWGHFELKSDFPEGWKSLKNCVEIAEQQNVYLGVHTLSNFITTNDPYVTPIPDPRLASVGKSQLSQKIDESTTVIEIASPEFFNQFDNNNLKTIRIGEELIRYGSVSSTEPWRLMDCQRGAFETMPSGHKQGTMVSKLADHAYKVFLTSAELGEEMAKNLAALYNETGIRQISFDGLEGNRSTGMGNYGEILFTNTWYENLSDDIKSHYIADASRTSHFFWHMYTRMNWGEPWYADFRVSQTEYRLKNQKYFKRNLMPGMLGWFSMRSNTSIEDIEWMLSRSAAFNAGYSFVTNLNTLKENNHTPRILHLINIWEQARMADAFSEDQKKRMEDINNEFQLSNENDQWIFNQVFSYKFDHESKIRQPGEPLYTSYDYLIDVSDRPMHFIISASGSDISNISLEFDNYKKLDIPGGLRNGETIKYQGGPNAIVYSNNWEKIREIDMGQFNLELSKGKHRVQVDCSFTNVTESAKVKIEIRIIGNDENISM